MHLIDPATEERGLNYYVLTLLARCWMFHVTLTLLGWQIVFLFCLQTYSAGVGRSGTYIVVDRVLQHMQDNDSIDILGIVYEMRHYRPFMVQTEVMFNWLRLTAWYTGLGGCPETTCPCLRLMKSGVQIFFNPSLLFDEVLKPPNMYCPRDFSEASPVCNPSNVTLSKVPG